jgi:hypothetical protein
VQGLDGGKQRDDLVKMLDSTEQDTMPTLKL